MSKSASFRDGGRWSGHARRSAHVGDAGLILQAGLIGLLHLGVVAEARLLARLHVLRFPAFGDAFDDRLMARDGLGGGLLLVRLDLVDAIEPGLGAGCVASILLFGVVLVGRVAGLAAHFLAPVLSVAVAVAQDLVRDRRDGAGPRQEGERQQDAEKVLRHERRLQWTD